MAFLGVEQVFGEIEAVLAAGYAAKAAALNAEYDDGVAISAPQSYLRMFDPADQGELNAVSYPAVVLRPEPEDVTEGPRLGDEYKVATPFEVAVMEGYDSASRQQTRLLRHMRIVKELLAPEASLACGSVAYLGGGFSRTWTTDSGIMRDVAMVFAVTLIETP